MNFQIFNTKCNKTEKIFIAFLGISLGILILKLFFISTITLYSFLTFFVISALFCSLVFLAYYDLKKLEVHNATSLVLVIILSLINILIFLLLKNDRSLTITATWSYNAYNNIMGALILGSIFQLIVLLSKERALGQGDVRIALIVGLLLGSTNLLVWSYITVFGTLIYGLFIAAKKRKFFGLKIPLVPFMVLGTVVILLIII